MAYDRLAPFDRQDHLLAQVLTLLANVYRDLKKRPRHYSVEDFLPDPLRSKLLPAEEQRVIARTQAELMRKYMENREGRA
jgi:hypothetical protein